MNRLIFRLIRRANKRGYLLNHLINIFGDDKKGIPAAIVLHAIIFGTLHVSQSIPGVISTGFVAVVLAGIYLVNRRSLFPLIIAHGVVNSLGLFVYYQSNGQVPQ